MGDKGLEESKKSEMGGESERGGEEKKRGEEKRGEERRGEEEESTLRACSAFSYLRFSVLT